MSNAVGEDLKRDRSPNYPKIPLEQAIEMVDKLYRNIGKTKVKAVVAVTPLGYTGLSGASLTTLGALTAYGLIDRERGESVSVSQLAIRLLHPIDQSQHLSAKRESVLRPKVFLDLFSGGFQRMSEDTLSKHLIQSGFTPDGAMKAAYVFKENVSFAKLDQPGIVAPNADDKKPISHEYGASLMNPPPLNSALTNVFAEKNAANKITLADYSIPLGGNEARLAIYGDSLSVADFDALLEYIELFKKNFERKTTKTKQETPPTK